MSENPLLPHAQLRALHALMQQCRTLERKHKPTSTAREALLAATSIHLQPGDLISAAPNDATPSRLAPAAKNTKRTSTFDPPTTKPASRLLQAAAAARGLQAASAARDTSLLLAFAQANAPEPDWEAALTWAQQAELPLLLACADATGGKPARTTRTSEPPLNWATISRLSHRTKLPVISVDGEDAVAIYRVMQESVLRTRMGGGPAVIWAVMNTATAKPSLQPIARLRQYMATRKISLR